MRTQPVLSVVAAIHARGALRLSHHSETPQLHGFGRFLRGGSGGFQPRMTWGFAAA